MTDWVQGFLPDHHVANIQLKTRLAFASVVRLSALFHPRLSLFGLFRDYSI
jgi:hypothetical protein